jgi:hypothetical protein
VDAGRSDRLKGDIVMPNQIETRAGTCPTHGTVQATRTMPKPGFPFLVYAVRRLLAGNRPYRCPDCGTAVTSA